MKTKTPNKRLFIALPLQETTNQALDTYCHQIAKQYPDTKIRFTPTVKRHLTLSFLGALTNTQINDVTEIIKTFEYSAIQLQLTTICRFPDNESKIITALPKASSELESLHKKLQNALESKGFPELSRPFRPHISLTRIKNTDDQLPMLIEPPIAMPVSEIILYESQLTETGSCYIPMEKNLLSRS